MIIKINSAKTKKTDNKLIKDEFKKILYHFPSLEGKSELRIKIDYEKHKLIIIHAILKVYKKNIPTIAITTKSLSIFSAIHEIHSKIIHKLEKILK